MLINEQMPRVTESNKKFISTDNIQDKQKLISIASFPRSGNTMVRNIYENVTQSFTGDDMVTIGHLSTFYGLGLVNNISNVFLSKTHYPFMNFRSNEFKSQGAILIVRNPFDAFDSFFEFSQTDSHTTKLSESKRQDENTQLAFKRFVSYLIGQYKTYHEYWINNILEKIPVKVFKYESFSKNKDKETKELFEFLFRFKADKAYFNNFTEEEITNIIQENKEFINTSSAYKPRAEGKNYQSLILKRFDRSQLDLIVSELWEVLNFFDYITEFKSLDISDLNLAIKKKEEYSDILQESRYKIKNFMELPTISDKLFERFEKVKPEERDDFLINGDPLIECQFATNLKSFWASD